MPVSDEKTEVETQKSLLATRVGAKGSGAARYAAAMYFYTEKLMPEAMLEIYRRCSKLDGEDPIDLAKYEGVQIPTVAAKTVEQRP